MAPAALEVALAVHDEIAGRIAQAAESLRQTQLERARYDAELARRRYLKVDPDHRLVADSLEAEWNGPPAPPRCPSARSMTGSATPTRDCSTTQARTRIRGLATDFPRVWNDPNHQRHSSASVWSA